ncbi:ester cyclase-like protein [Vibrio cholerae HE48]|nr:ester cyclase-like protein [Vibrio cholerae HE48]
MHNLQPTGKKVRFSLMMQLKIKDGKIIEKRAHFNEVDIMKQLQS